MSSEQPRSQPAPSTTLASGPRVDRVSELIGNTPLIKLREIGKEGGAPIYIKLENLNPSGSIRDRYIAEILQRSVEAGQTMSGDAIALAGINDSGVSASLLGHQLGLSVHVFAPEDASRRLARLVLKLGAKITWTSAEGGLDGAIEAAASWAREAPDRLYVDAFRRQAIKDAYQGIADEMMLALRGQQLGAFVTSISTGGTFREVAPYLRRSFPMLRMGGAVLIDADTKTLAANPNNIIEHIPLERAWEVRDLVARTQGLLLGPKGAACVALAMDIQEQIPGDQVIVALNPDAGQRYLGWEDKPLFKDTYIEGCPSKQ
jgi:cysteine synthase A